MRLHFLVVAHRDPVLVARLCERLLTVPDATITLQWDRAAGVPSLPTGLEVDRRITRAPCEWGSGAQLDAMLDSLRSLVTSSFDWLLLLSGQDYPIRPMHDLVEFLTSTSHLLFLETPAGGTVKPPTAHDAKWTYLQDRYFYRYRWVPQRTWSRLSPSAQRFVAAGMQRAVRGLAPRRSFRVQRRPRGFSPALGTRTREYPFTPLRPCRKGSDWFAISRPVFDDLLEQIEASPDLVRYFRRTYLPIESFFHTLLLPTWESNNAGHNLHYRRFIEGRSHPEILDEDDWEQFVASGGFFARKVDATSSALLDRIDRELLGL